MSDDPDEMRSVRRGIRLDLAIALCALLISTVAAGASWWQARILQGQTAVLEQQLGAQVWPYISVSEGLSGDTVQLDVSNDGLGPAVLRSLVALVDGVPRSNSIDVLHAILGPDLIANSRHGERIGLRIDTSAAGAVVRPGTRGYSLSFTSKRYASQLLLGSKRLTFQICYCAIIPNTCWLIDTRSTEPRSIRACAIVPNDLLHAPAFNEVAKPDF